VTLRLSATIVRHFLLQPESTLLPLSQLRRFHPLATPSILSAVSILRRILAAYAHYYSDARTHLALNKNTPAERVVQRAGSITSDRTDT